MNIYSEHTILTLSNLKKEKDRFLARLSTIWTSCSIFHETLCFITDILSIHGSFYIIGPKTFPGKIYLAVDYSDIWFSSEKSAKTLNIRPVLGLLLDLAGLPQYNNPA